MASSFPRFKDHLVREVPSLPRDCEVGWPVPFLTLRTTLLERYHPEPRHCEVGWPVPFLALRTTLLERYHPIMGETRDKRKQDSKIVVEWHRGCNFALPTTNQANSKRTMARKKH